MALFYDTPSHPIRILDFTELQFKWQFEIMSIYLLSKFQLSITVKCEDINNHS